MNFIEYKQGLQNNPNTTLQVTGNQHFESLAIVTTLDSADGKIQKLNNTEMAIISKRPIDMALNMLYEKYSDNTIAQTLIGDIYMTGNIPSTTAELLEKFNLLIDKRNSKIKETKPIENLTNKNNARISIYELIAQNGEIIEINNQEELYYMDISVKGKSLFIDTNRVVNEELNAGKGLQSLAMRSLDMLAEKYNFSSIKLEVQPLGDIPKDSLIEIYKSQGFSIIGEADNGMPLMEKPVNIMSTNL